MSAVSRSAAALIARRCLGCTPNRAKLGGGPRHGQGLGAIVPPGPTDQAELLELAKLVVADARGIGELTAAEQRRA